jgi:hypothetical protein
MNKYQLRFLMKRLFSLDTLFQVCICILCPPMFFFFLFINLCRFGDEIKAIDNSQSIYFNQKGDQ